MDDIVITVHGTGDSEVLADRVKWWQQGSPFERALLPYLGTDNRAFEPFVWSGQNSERERRKAGRQLARKLRLLEKERQAYHLIGHSHGGSVIAEAVIFAARSGAAFGRHQRLKGLRSVTSVGTPFLDFGIKRLSTQNLLRGMFGLFNNFQGVLGWVFGVLLASFIIAFAGPRTLAVLVFGKGNRVESGMRRRLDKSVTPRWICLWHKHDEAIAALRAAPKVNFSIFRAIKLSNMFDWVTSTATFIGLFAGFGVLIGAFLPFIEAGFSGDISISGGIVTILFVLSVYAFLTALIAAGLRFVSRYVIDPPFRALVGRWLDGIVNAEMRQNAFGLDLSSERLRDVTVKPVFATEAWESLPEPIHGEMLALVDQSAAKTVAKLRAFIGTPFVPTPREDFLGMLTQQLSWDELLHTTYFSNPRFVKLVAYGMFELSGTPPSDRLTSEPDYPQIVAVYQSLRVPA